jgi:hypothetical protein
MSPRAPDLDSLLGGAVFGSERDRLARVHEALVRAGSPPVLPGSLAQPPVVGAPPVRRARAARPRRRLRPAAVAATVAAAAAVAAFVLLSGGEGPRRAVAMHGTATAPRAHADLRIGARDAAGNWLLTMRVRGLPPLPAGAYYALELTRKGRIVVGCGTFKTHPGTTVVRFDVPFRLGGYSGWVVRREQPQRRPGPTLLST